MYSYQADAGLFAPCGGAERVPVAPVADNAALESAYVEARQDPGEQLLATVIGRIETRERMEGPPGPTLVVTEFIRVAAGDCGTPSEARLEDTYWRLSRLPAAGLTPAPGSREPYIVLRSGDRRMAGYSGCNRMMGGYTLAADRLEFTQVAGTMMACQEGMEAEQALQRALERVRAWRIDGAELELLDEAAVPILVFEARHLREPGS